MKITAIYDNGGKTLDRLTVLTDQLADDSGVIDRNQIISVNNRKTVMALGMSETGSGFSQWGEALAGRHLGKRVQFEDLSEATQKHIARRIFNE